MKDDSAETREAHVPLPATAIASHLVRAHKADEYLEAQTAITEAAQKQSKRSNGAHSIAMDYFGPPTPRELEFDTDT